MLRAPPYAPVLVVAVLAGALATACGAPAATPRTQRAITISSGEVVPPAREVTEPVAVAPIGPTVLIDRAHDPNHVAAGTSARVSATVERTLERAGFAATPLGDGATSTPAFLVSPTVVALTVTPEGSRTTISCRVTLRIAPWSAVDQRERWEPHTTALASGEARATTSNARKQIDLGISDCLEAAVHAAASREVIPFLRRIAIED